jgi:beta-glucuronidase
MQLHKVIKILFLSALGTIILFKASIAQKSGPTFPEIPPSVLPPALIDFDDGQDPMECRLFRTTEFRTQVNLNGYWNFIIDPADSGEIKNYQHDFPEPETQLWVPGTWNALPRYWQYQGVAWLQRTFELPRAGTYRIRFAGVFYLSKVWIDGKLVGENEGAYSPFTLILAKMSAGQHAVTVRVDSRLNDESLPKDGVDWFPYGGIYRPVYLERVPVTFIDNFYIISSEISPASALLKIRVFLKNLDGKKKNKKLSFYVNGVNLYQQMHQISGKETEIVFHTILKNPRLWSPEKPRLYSARLVLGDNEDDQYDRFGIRDFKADGYRILLNGQPFKLMGANRHEDHPDWGSALPPHIVRNDVEILNRMGANAVRGHYPPSEMFLDYCDQNGLVFMNEVPSWQYRPEQLANKVVKNKIKKQYWQMIYRDMNHPAIFSWSLGNEWREFHKSYSDIKELMNYARTLDSTHFVTFITGGAQTDRSAELVDIICTNWAKFQWYWDPSFSDEDSAERVRSTVLDEKVAEVSLEQLNRIHDKFPNKPVILTEFGGSGSQAGWHNWGNVKWSEEYQARNVWDSGKYGLEEEWISGGCVWQFCDTRTAHLRMLGPRFRGWNAKGVVDAYRQPKMSFYKLQEIFHNYLLPEAAR